MGEKKSKKSLFSTNNQIHHSSYYILLYLFLYKFIINSFNIKQNMKSFFIVFIRNPLKIVCKLLKVAGHCVASELFIT